MLQLCKTILCCYMYVIPWLTTRYINHTSVRPIYSTSSGLQWQIIKSINPGIAAKQQLGKVNKLAKFEIYTVQCR